MQGNIFHWNRLSKKVSFSEKTWQVLRADRYIKIGISGTCCDWRITAKWKCALSKTWLQKDKKQSWHKTFKYFFYCCGSASERRRKRLKQFPRHLQLVDSFFSCIWFIFYLLFLSFLSSSQFSFTWRQLTFTFASWMWGNSNQAFSRGHTQLSLDRHIH